MSKEIIFKNCIHNLRKILNEVKDSSDQENTKRIDRAIFFAKEIDSLWPADIQMVPDNEKSIGSDFDSTNYETYKLLKSFGLSLDELVQVAKNENLPELRIVRMVRLVYEIGLDEACYLLKDFLKLEMLKKRGQVS